jgi:hypothetical protein
MNPTEVVVGEVKTIRGPQVLPLFGKRIRQARHAAHAHSDREILTLHMRRANLRGVRVAHDWDLLRMRDIRRTVGALTFRVLRVAFNQLREVAAVAKGSGDRRDVRLKSIGADLKPLRRSRRPQTFDENIRGRLAAAAQGEIENELRIAFDSDEAVGFTGRIIMGLFGPLWPSFFWTYPQISSH